ncbi:MAG: response regulator transcription factor [Lachnospiraceae bacterium]|nr:response regulator transcription factor [Lachnospiraceae bacterium]
MLIYLCDDSDADSLRLQHYLNAFARENGLHFDTKIFSSGKTLIASWMNAPEKPVLVFLDIYMEGLSGVDTARRLRDMGYNAGIIFTTSSAEHAMDSYEVNALYYLHKPYDREDFGRAMERCRHILDNRQEFFTFKHKKKSLSVSYDDILFFETGSLSHSIIMHTIDGAYFFIGTMSQVTKALEQSTMFLAVGRSFTINLNHVSDTMENDLIMSDNSIIQIPLRKRKEVFAAIEKWQSSKEHSV